MTGTRKETERERERAPLLSLDFRLQSAHSPRAFAQVTTFISAMWNTATPSAPITVVHVAGKGLGVVADGHISAGQVLVEETPLFLMEPPTARRDLLLLLGAKRFSRLTEPEKPGGAKPGPDAIRIRVYKTVLDTLVDRMTNEDRSTYLSLSDRRAEARGEQKTLWGIWETNCVPTDSYRSVRRSNACMRKLDRRPNKGFHPAVL